MAKNVLIDTGYWIALLNERDKHHETARVLENDLSVHTLLIPWPTLFECVDTRLARRKHSAMRFKQLLRRPSSALVDDSPYRQKSLDFVLEQPNHRFSLTDHIIRSMIEDVRLSIHAFVGFNPGDFYNVCAARGVDMLRRN